MTREPVPPVDDDGRLRPWATWQPWDHGPVGMVGPRAEAVCFECGWRGPDRTGDPHAAGLLADDVAQHAHHMGVRCGMCEACAGSGPCCDVCGRPAHLDYHHHAARHRYWCGHCDPEGDR